jgi:hypothetical protein
MNMPRWCTQFAEKYCLSENIMALQITSELESSIHAGWRAAQARNGLKVDKLGLGTASHAAVAAFLRVNSQWLLTGEGPMATTHAIKAPTELSPTAIELGAVFDMIPVTDKIRHAQAFNVASTAIVKVLQS